MVGVEVRILPRPCRQLCGTAFCGSRQCAQSSKPAPVVIGRCWLELWGFSRPSGAGAHGKRTIASGNASSCHPPRPAACHVLASQRVVFGAGPPSGVPCAAGPSHPSQVQAGTGLRGILKTINFVFICGAGNPWGTFCILSAFTCILVLNVCTLCFWAGRGPCDFVSALWRAYRYSRQFCRAALKCAVRFLPFFGNYFNFSSF